MAAPDDSPNLIDNRWLAFGTRRATHRGVRRVVRELEPRGVTSAIPFLGYYVEPVVWLITRSDADRDLLLHAGIPRNLVIQRLRESGVRADLAERAEVTVESEETVKRDYGGNWRTAMH